MQGLSVGRGRLSFRDGFAQGRRQPVAAPDDVQSNPFLDAMPRFGQEIFLKNAENRVDLSLRPLPIGRGKGKQRKRVDSQLRGDADNLLGGSRPGAVSGRPWEGARSGPPSVAVADNGHV